MTENALDDALADLVEAFGYFSEAELQTFLDVMPPAGARLSVPASDRGVLDCPASVSVASREAFDFAQAARA
ncbi:hypothetical protein [Methylobacterium sp. R2-1]|uniref:hypothetical protein n=1 Tax=Methylobacterium sp. R2-1 TaxID=2587064 RepID=UPI00161761F6|nr:hypothetical protein [Methylobacterium sp. R2-1]MBB2962785.1 hypothetical protein [Methylobacterium sp. R2-1]